MTTKPFGHLHPNRHVRAAVFDSVPEQVPEQPPVLSRVSTHDAVAAPPWPATTFCGAVLETTLHLRHGSKVQPTCNVV
ncbi:MAG: hypothetical protein ABEH86_13825 [Haloarcula sp.]